jgi:hypothetical protein
MRLKRCKYCNRLVWPYSFTDILTDVITKDYCDVGHVDCYETYFFPVIGNADYRGCP